MTASKKKNKSIQSEINIGLVGHVDHGKTTLVEALSGEWTDRHSEEKRRGISIKLGYADTVFMKCPSCPEPDCYTTEFLAEDGKKCPKCGADLEVLRRVSFVDAPGHEVLMATMISGAALMDGAVLVIAANEQCPQPQTREHFASLKITQVSNVVITQNKIEIVPKERAIENYKQIHNFIEDKIEAPIIPISAIHKANIDLVIQSIEKNIPTPKRKVNVSPLMWIARSFDINRPGSTADELMGGVVGGSISRGKLKVGDEIMILPGLPDKENPGEYIPLTTEITSLTVGNEFIDEAGPGGLIGVGTKLDSSITKADSLIGNVLGYKDKLPPLRYELKMDVHLLDRVVGLKTTADQKMMKVKNLKTNEKLMLNIGASTLVGVITSINKYRTIVKLIKPVCCEQGDRVAISRLIKQRWRLIGYGVIKE
ncbi:MAG: translation initiation factor IF-2 subunit gamma [Candidatus Lokiarchaeota archaeon]|nr:translation initiation factor IF-2 subunit gamma [Candidatus Lokiarchaeota archaeon]